MIGPRKLRHFLQSRVVPVAAVCVLIAAAADPSPARAEAQILVDVETGKVLRAENATYPWYPASVTKLMTLYVTLQAIRQGRITKDTLFTVSRNAMMQAPTKMGFAIGTQVTVDNALKMMMVKSANDMAVLLAEGVGGSIENFSDEMTQTAHRLGMSESNFVNPNGLPADGQITSARDLAILARALIRDFPDDNFYWHIPAIKFRKRVVENYNRLIGRYPGADGMKTGFICASGFNLVATATRGNRHLIAVVLGAPSSAARAVKAAELLESGFMQNPLEWLTPTLGTVSELKPIDAPPPNLHDQVCGGHRKKPAAEDEDDDAAGVEPGSAFSTVLSALRAPTPHGVALLSDSGAATPVVVYTGPTRANPEIGVETADEPAPHGRHKRAAKADADAKETAKDAGKDNGKDAKPAKADRPSKKESAAPQPAATNKKADDKKAGDKKADDGKPDNAAKQHGKPTGAKSSDAKSFDAKSSAAAPAAAVQIKREAQSDPPAFNAPAFNAPSSGVLPKPQPPAKPQASPSIAD